MTVNTLDKIILFGMHLAGKQKSIGLILAGFDPVAVDTLGSELLGHKPKMVDYFTLANSQLGSMKNIEILNG